MSEKHTAHTFTRLLLLGVLVLLGGVLVYRVGYTHGLEAGTGASIRAASRSAERSADRDRNQRRRDNLMRDLSQPWPVK